MEWKPHNLLAFFENTHKWKPHQWNPKEPRTQCRQFFLANTFPTGRMAVLLLSRNTDSLLDIITYKSNLTQKKLYNKTDAIFSIYGKNGINPWHFFWILTLTLLNFLLHYLQEYSKIWNTEKSNKSELWNRLSYRGLPYHFEVRSQTFRNECKSWRSQPRKFNLDFHSTSTTSKGLSENSKKKSWVNPVFPIDTKNSIGFFVHFFLG